MILQIKDDLGNWVSIPAIQGEPGKDGADGLPGVDGATPVKGIDYWTAADKQEIIDDVLASLPSGEEAEY